MRASFRFGAMDRLKNYYVKFVPYNEECLEYIGNNYLRYSRVTDFNDLTEFHYKSSFLNAPCFFEGENGRKADFINAIRKNLKLNEFRKFIDSYASERAYKEKVSKILNSCLEERNFEDCQLKTIGRILEECMAYYHTGIACFSKVEVFEGDTAALMYGHYSASGKGLALIYEITNEGIKEVEYPESSNEQSDSPEDNRRPCTAEYVERILDWIVHRYDGNRMGDFLRKSRGWSYEREFRLFGNPAVKAGAPAGVNLKAILYTSRLPAGENTIEKIRSVLPNPNISIEKIYADHHDCYRFVIDDPEQKKWITISEWLKKNVCSKDRNK